jgi:hypothetical protein
MPEMAEQRAIRLVHRRACQLAGQVISFRRSDCDQPLLVSGHGRNNVAVKPDGILEEIENEAANRVLLAIGVRQFPAQQRVEEMPLCLADAPPPVDSVLRANVRHQAIVAARNAKIASISLVDQPIADVEAGVGTEANPAFGMRGEPPIITIPSLQGVHGEIVREECEPEIASDTVAIVEMNDLVAAVAGKQSHRTPLLFTGYHD